MDVCCLTSRCLSQSHLHLSLMKNMFSVTLCMQPGFCLFLLFIYFFFILGSHPAELCCMQVSVLQVFVIVTSFSVCRAPVTEIRTDRLWVCVESRAPAVCCLTSTLIFHTEFVHVQSCCASLDKGPLKHTAFSRYYRALSVRGSASFSK